MACIAASSRPSASSTTASGLPAPGRSANTSTWTNGRSAIGQLLGSKVAELSNLRSPIQGAAQRCLYLAADPGLAIGIDVQLELRIAAEFTALAGQVAAVAPGQAAVLVQQRGDAGIGAAGGRVFGNAHAGRERAHHQV